MKEILNEVFKNGRFIKCKIDRCKYYNEHRFEAVFVYKYKDILFALHYLQPSNNIKTIPRKKDFKLYKVVSYF